MPRVCNGFASLPTGNCGEVNLHLVKTAATCIVQNLSSGLPMGNGWAGQSWGADLKWGTKTILLFQEILSIFSSLY